MPRQSSSPSSPSGPSSDGVRHRSERRAVSTKLEAGDPFDSRSLCYRAALDADQSRAAPAPSKGAPPSPAGADRIVDRRSDPPRRPHGPHPHGGLLAGAGAVVAVGAYNYYASGLPDPVEALTNIQFEQQTVIYDRTGKIELARLGDLKRELVTFDQLPGEMHRRDDRDRGQGLLGQPGLRPGRHRLGRPRHRLRQAPRRLDHHPAARPRPAPAGVGVRGHDLRAQGARDHPVDPPDPGLPGRGRQASRSSPPTSTRTSTATRATA